MRIVSVTDSDTEFIPTYRPAIFYGSANLCNAGIYHLSIDVHKNTIFVGSYDFIEIARDLYFMAVSLDSISIISKQELEVKYHCAFDANGGYKIYKNILAQTYS